MTTTFSLKDQVIIVTGASSGIGQATARHLAKLGANVVLGARREQRLQALADSIGPQAVYQTTDVTQRHQLEALAALAIKRFGRIDGLINNAGIMPASPIELGLVDDWDRMIDVNIKGVLYGINAVLGHMQEHGGTIVNMASVTAHHAGPGGAVYSGTKAAVKLISEGLRKEVTGKVRICVIYPGITESEIPDSITVPAIKDVSTQMYRSAMPAQAIAEAVAYALTQPPGVAVNEITVRPLAMQDF